MPSSGETMKKIPKAAHELLSQSHNLVKNHDLSANRSFPKKKRSAMNVHCKIILPRNSNFPFMMGNPHEERANECCKSKRDTNHVKNSPFTLDISCIDEKEEPVSPLFISKESM